MATDTRNLDHYIIDNTAVRAWGAGISAALAAAGLVKTADTGQVNWTTTSFTASGTGQLIGYEVWRFNDALQATAPVFIRVEYRTSTGYYFCGAVRMAVGSGTNGAGALTGSVSDGTSFITAVGSDIAGTGAYPHYTAGDGGFLTHAGPMATQANICSTFVIDRFRDADGSPNGEGVSILFCPNSATGSKSAHVKFGSPGTAPTLTGVPSPWVPGTKLEGADTGVAPILPASPAFRPAIVGAFLYVSTDIAQGSDIVVPVYGANHTFKTLGGWSGYWASPPGSGFSATACVAVRWE